MSTIEKAIDHADHGVQYSDTEIQQINAIADVIMQIVSCRGKLRDVGVNTGSGFQSIALLGMSEQALRDHLSALCSKHVLKGE